MKTEILELKQIIRGQIVSISTSDYEGEISNYYNLIYQTKNGDLLPIKIKTKNVNHSLQGKYVELDCIVYHIKGNLYRTSISERILEEV